MQSIWSLTRRRRSPPVESRDSEKQETFVVVPEEQSQQRLAMADEPVELAECDKAEQQQQEEQCPPLKEDEGFELVNHDDASDAIAHFVCSQINGIADIRNKPPEELRRLIIATVRQSERSWKQIALNIYKWGRFAYSSVYWGMMALACYSNPLILRTMWSTTWAAIQLITGI